MIPIHRDDEKPVKPVKDSGWSSTIAMLGLFALVGWIFYLVLR